MPKDLYSILEVQRSADASEIRKAYLNISRKVHPDKVPESEKAKAEERFKEVSHAYEVLGDEQKKAYYDQTGQEPGDQAQQGPPGGFPFDLNSMFGMFGGGRGFPQRGRRQGKAPPRKTQIPLTLKDFYFGRSLKIHLERQKFCPGCKGEGSINVKSCSDCNGSGVKRQIIQMGPMIMDNTGPCMPCGGSGKARGDSCGQCRGSKFIKEDKALELTIPKGAKVGDIITFVGESSQVEEYEEPGDVIVELIGADEDHGWQRQGNNLHHRVSLSLGEALCGKTIKLDGHPAYPHGLFVTLPQGVMNRQDIVIEDCGMPYGSSYGSVVLTMSVMASKEERVLLETKKDVLQDIFQINDSLTIPEGMVVKIAKPLIY